MRHQFDGGKLRQARVARDIPTEAVALAIGRSARSVLGYETGEHIPPAKLLADLAEAVGADVADLFTPAAQ